MSKANELLRISVIVLGLLAFIAPGVRARGEDVDSALTGIGIRNGLCVILGLPRDGGPSFVTGLAGEGELVVYFQSPDEREVIAVREAAEEAGLLGTRVFADRGSWNTIHLADNLAGAIWAGDFDAGTTRAEPKPEVKAHRVTDETDTKPADWMHYRADATWRSSTGIAVGESVRLAWTHRPKSNGWVTPAVAAYGTVFVGGGDGAVRALDAATGNLRWKKFTGGAMYFPPTVWKGRVLAGSCDGRVYAFEAATGRALWRTTLAPEERRIPMYGSLVSRWPVSSGVLVHDDVLHAVAGTTHYDGMYLYTLDPSEGRVISRKVSPKLNILKGIRIAGTPGKEQVKYLYGNHTNIHTRMHRPPIALPVDFPDGRVALKINRRPALGFSYYRGTFPEGKRTKKDPAWTSSGVILPSGDRALPSYEAFVRTANAILILGSTAGKEKGAAPSNCVAALSLTDGSPLWVEPLPGTPVRWGLCVDSEGRILVSLEDGSVLCFAALP